ncbi:MAG TPA: ERAP1-like C-terminal domain-containing protein [Thermoanaerobaculia bacterium]|nr:ERAP1-like C-terminal domain-containing protein [Thermoanaerobaculia bacterium]
MPLLRLVLVALFVCPSALAAAPRAFTPRHYDLRLVPGSTTFEGSVTIDGVASEPLRAVTLDAKGLTIDDASIGGQQADLELGSDTITLRVPSAVAAGAVQLRLRYRGVLSGEPHGLTTIDANGKRYLATRLQRTHAREVFPSFDRPDLATTFAIEVVVPPGQTAISNAGIAEDSIDHEGVRTVRFATTPPLQTHAVALVVGELACAADRSGEVPLRVCAAASQLPQATFALEATKQFLPFYATYFGAPYPFPKLDFVVIPGFSTGAEESAGVVMARERALLIGQDGAPEMKKAIAAIIAHELSHMWGGGIASWDDFWLYEGNADFLAAKAVAAWKPEWWTATDAVNEARRAIATDTLHTARPLAPENASSVKTPAVLRMLEEYAPFETKRAALRNTTRGSASRAILDSFATQPGVPLVRVQSRCVENKTQLTLTQERFTTDATPSAQLWSIPVCYRGAETNDCALLKTKSATFSVDGCGPLIVNREGRGYYITSYESGSAPVALMTPAERLTLLNDEWSLMRAGRRGADAFLRLADRYRSERDGAVVTRLVTALDAIGRFVRDERALGEYQSWVREFLRPLVHELGWSDAETPGCGCGALRPMVLYAAGVTGRDPETLGRAKELALTWLDDPSAIDPPLVRNVLAMAAASNDARLYERILERLRDNAASPDETALLTRTITRFRAPAQVKRTFDWILSDVAPADAARLLGALLTERESQRQAWQLITNDWTRVEKKIAPAQAGQVVIAARSFCDPALRDDVQRFFTSHPVPGSERDLAETLDVIGQCAALFSAQQPHVAAWLERQRAHTAAAAN